MKCIAMDGLTSVQRRGLCILVHIVLTAAHGLWEYLVFLLIQPLCLSSVATLDYGRVNNI